ncbi:oocyte-secreted protein 2-like [Notamacropus eugenii]|uniref:oocyte-secreted protein 2-like n=1 Tax=Notamacropus eugenii TaxID=9315 RepID=UPI003B66C5F7
MKAFQRLSVLCILVFQAWTQDYPVTSKCTLLDLLVSVRRNLFNDGIWISSNDVILGDGCSVNNVVTDVFEFQYSVRECGIYTEVYATKLIFKTVIYYTPTSYGRECFHSKTEFYVSCSVDRTVSPQYSLISSEEDPQSSERRYQACTKRSVFSSPEFHFFLFK